MTKQTAAQNALVALAGNEWNRHKAFTNGLEATIRARVETEMEDERRRSATKVGAAMKVAIDGGATRASVKLVTTKDHNTFHSYLALNDPPPEAEVEVVIESPRAEVTLSIRREADLLRIWIDPETVPIGEHHGHPDAWEGPFEVFIHPQTGVVFIDPTNAEGYDRGKAVTDWIRDDERNLQRIRDWLEANPN